MKKSSIRILGKLFREIHAQVLATGADESVAFVTAKHFDTGEKTVFLGETMVIAKSNDYLRQGPYHLRVSPAYANLVINNEFDNKAYQKVQYFGKRIKLVGQDSILSFNLSHSRNFRMFSNYYGRESHISKIAGRETRPLF